MKLKIFTLGLVTFLLCSSSYAKILRVGYNGIALSGVDFGDWSSAHTAANNGDTIQIYPGSYSGSVTKRLVVMGFGYNLDAHPGLQNSNADAPFTLSLSFQNGSQNSIVEGCNLNASLYASNITIRRSRGSFYMYNYDSSINNIRIESCVMESGGTVYQGYSDCKNFQVFNSIISSINIYNAGSTGSIINCASASPNYGGSSINLYNSGFLVKNSIIATYNSANINTVWENNFFSSAQPATLPPGSNNRWSQDWATLFTRNGGTDDGVGYMYYGTFDENFFVLKTGSPAINGGKNAAGAATDCGIFGGELAYRYRLSGIPAVPAIYKLEAAGSSATTNPYNVTISVRSNN